MNTKTASTTGVNFWQAFRSTIRGIDAPQQLAWGLTIGLIAGVMPKFSAIPFLLLLFLVLSRANLATGIFGAIAGHFLGHFLMPMFDSAGYWCLTSPVLQTPLSSAHELPFVAWLCINNTIVAGSIFYSILALIPLYVLSRVLCGWLQPWLVLRWRNFTQTKTHHA
ncbi:MAG: TIGR03546 family protein [Pirellulaceae bacterium]